MTTTVNFAHWCPACRVYVASVTAENISTDKILDVGSPLPETVTFSKRCPDCQTIYELKIVSVDGKAHHAEGGTL